MSRWTYEARPVEPSRVEAVFYDGHNFREVQEFFDEQGPYAGGEPIQLRTGEVFFENPSAIYFPWDGDEVCLPRDSWLILTREDRLSMMLDKTFRERFRKHG